MKIQVSDLALTEGEGSPHSHTAKNHLALSDATNPTTARHLPQTSPLSLSATLSWPLLTTGAVVLSPNVGPYLGMVTTLLRDTYPASISTVTDKPIENGARGLFVFSLTAPIHTANTNSVVRMISAPRATATCPCS